MNPDLKRMCVMTCYKGAVSSRSSAGDPVIGSPTSFVAYVENIQERFVQHRGVEIQAEHRIYTETAIAYTDVIWLPGVSTSSANNAKRPMVINSYYDRAGAVDHYEVYLGKSGINGV